MLKSKLLSALTIQISTLHLRQLATVALQRDARYNTLNEADIRYFQDVVPGGVITDQHDLIPFNRDWMGKYQGSSTIAIKPKTTQQVATILKHCNSRNLAVVPQGGNTGLVGGSVPVYDEVVISTAAMNTITSFDSLSGTLVCQSGCILQNLDDYLANQGYTVPLDLGAKGSCHIGGNVATNAGGLRLLRYGSLHGSVLGLEAVLADGTILDTLSTLRKDNTGYDLQQLFIGSEGTLGIITAVSLLCQPRPRAVNVAYIAVESFDHALQALRLAKESLAEILSAFEFVDRPSVQLVLDYLPGARDPLPGSIEPFGLVIETSGSNAEHDMAKLETFLNTAVEQGIITNGVLAQDEQQAREIWRIREGVTEALRHRGAIYKYDVSMPIAEMYTLVEDMRSRLETHLSSSSSYTVDTSLDTTAISSKDDTKTTIKVVGYGHLGDGNLHLNISTPRYDLEIEQVIEPFIYEWIAARRGSVSAEHGLGLMKAKAIGYSKSPIAIELMKKMKSVLDPRYILNPYKMF